MWDLHKIIYHLTLSFKLILNNYVRPNNPSHSPISHDSHHSALQSRRAASTSHRPGDSQTIVSAINFGTVCLSCEIIPLLKHLDTASLT